MHRYPQTTPGYQSIRCTERLSAPTTIGGFISIQITQSILTHDRDSTRFWLQFTDRGARAKITLCNNLQVLLTARIETVSGLGYVRGSMALHSDRRRAFDNYGVLDSGGGRCTSYCVLVVHRMQVTDSGLIF